MRAAATADHSGGVTITNDPEVDHVVALERRLLDPVVRRSRERAGALIDAGFVEFGSSGTVWDRASILDALAADATPSAAADGFAATRLGADVVHLTYRTHSAQRTTLRSSLWHRHEGAWRILFHQGTVARRA